MEVLNRNQRKSAIWRIAGMGLFAVALIMTSVFAMHSHYSKQMTRVTAELKREVQTLKGEKQGLVSQVAELESSLEVYKGNSTSNSTAQALQKQLDECQSRMNIQNEMMRSKDATIQSLEAQLRNQPVN